MQGVQTKVRRRRLWHLILVCTVCLNYRKLRDKWNSLMFHSGPFSQHTDNRSSTAVSALILYGGKGWGSKTCDRLSIDFWWLKIFKWMCLKKQTETFMEIGYSVIFLPFSRREIIFDWLHFIAYSPLLQEWQLLWRLSLSSTRTPSKNKIGNLLLSE